MIKELLYKWFGLEPFPCQTCEILRFQLDESNRERRELLQKLLEKDKPESVSSAKVDELQPIRPQFTPWRVRQQMLEAEDRKQAQLLREKQKEMAESRKPDIADLEKELNIPTEGTNG